MQGEINWRLRCKKNINLALSSVHFLGAGYVRGLIWIGKITSFPLMTIKKLKKSDLMKNMINFVFRTSSVEKPVLVLNFWNEPVTVPFPYHTFEN